MDILTEALKRFAVKQATGVGQTQAQPQPQEPNPYTIKDTDRMMARPRAPVDDFAAMARRDGINPDGSRMAEVRSTGPGGSRDQFAGQKDTFEGRAAQGVYDGTVAQVVDFPHAVGQSFRKIYDDVQRGEQADPLDVGTIAVGAAPVAGPAVRAMGRGARQVTEALANIEPKTMAATAAGVAGASLGSDALNAAWSPEQEARRAQVQKELSDGKFNNPADRRAKEDELKSITRQYEEHQKSLTEQERERSRLEMASKSETERIAREAKAKSDANKVDEDARAVKSAEAVRDQALAKDTRFSDTAAGKLYNATGGFAPVIAALAAGGLDRVAKGAPKNWKDYGRLGVEGTGAAFTMNSVPLAYNAFGTETSNPQKDAYLGMARELPDGHAKKAALASYANGLPDSNPVRDTAQKELYDPVKLIERFGISAVEGVPSAWTGANVIGALSRLPSKAGEIPGDVRKGWNDGQAGADQAAIKARDARNTLGQQIDSEQQALRSGQQASEADLLAPPVATREGAASAQSATSTARPNQGPNTTPGQDQLRLPAPAENSSTKPFIEPGAEFPAPAPLPENGPTGRINQAALEYKPTTPDAVASMRNTPNAREALNRDDLAAVLAALQGASQPTKGPLKNAANPGTWAENVAPTARAQLEKHFDDGGTFKRGVGAKLSRDIDRELPPAIKRPSTSDVNDRIATMKDVLGESPSKAQIVKLLSDAPQSIYKGRKVFSVGAPLAAGAAIASQSEDPHVAIARALMGY